MVPRLYRKSFFGLVTLSTVILSYFMWKSKVNEYDIVDYEFVYEDEVLEDYPSDVPVLMWWTESVGFVRTIKCNDRICKVKKPGYMENRNVSAYLFYGSNINSLFELPMPRNINTLWGLFHEESPRNVEELMHEEILKLFNYSSTFSRYSDVPFPLHYLEKGLITSTQYYLPTDEKNELLTSLAPVLYIQTDCNTASERDEYVSELMKHIKIDSYGVCLNNRKQPESLSDDYLNKLYSDEFLTFTSRYKFVIAIENGVCYDYITEKLWRPIYAGSVPIYFGSPTVSDWLPNPKSAILLKDHPTPKLMADYLNELLKNDTLYDEYLEHKIHGRISNEKLLNEINREDFSTDFLKHTQRFECLMCEKCYEKRANQLVPRTIDKSHYDCPKPISALTLSVNPNNEWVYSWDRKKYKEIKEFFRWYDSLV